MTRDDIIRMAREAGHAVRNIDGEDEVMDGDNYHIQTKLIERFAALVAAAERNECAAIVDANAMACHSPIYRSLLQSNADAIRARGAHDQG